MKHIILTILLSLFAFNSYGAEEGGGGGNNDCPFCSILGESFCVCLPYSATATASAVSRKRKADSLAKKK